MLTHFAVYTQIAFFILLQNDFSVLSYDLLLLTNSTTLNGSSGPHAQALVASPQDSASAPLPVFPERPDAVYFVVAVVGGGKLWGRTLAKTLLDLGAPFNNPQGPPLRPIFVDLPQNGRLVYFMPHLFYFSALCRGLSTGNEPFSNRPTIKWYRRFFLFCKYYNGVIYIR